MQQAKNMAAGTDKEREATLACSEAIRNAREDYIQKTRTKLKDMQRGSKEWWALAAKIMGSADRACNIPALKSTSTGTWILSADGKANEIATTLASKYSLAEEVPNQYTAIKIAA